MNTSVIVALDFTESSSIAALVDRLPVQLRIFKVGLELFTAEGPAALEPLKSRQREIFLDLKLHDIPRTVERAVRAAAKHGVKLLTLHACGGRDMLEAAVAAARSCGPSAPALLAVTVLTSMDAADLRSIGVSRQPHEQVLELAEIAISAGVDGLVCSPREVGELRRRLGPQPILVTPGIRMPNDSKGDQKRTATPAEAVRAGATHLVIGRPIVESTNPAEAYRAIMDDIATGVTPAR